MKPFNQSIYKPEPKKFSGDFVMHGITIDDFDITNLWSQLDIYESLETPMTADLLLVDSIGLIYKNPTTGSPIMGGEVVKVSVDDHEYTFRVTGLHSRSIINNTTITYVLSLVSEDWYHSNHQNLSKSFILWKYEDIIEWVLREKLGSRRPFFVHAKTLEKECIISPSMQPLEFCSLLASRAESQDERWDNANYMFFETVKGWHFIPYEMLLDYEQNIPFTNMSIDTIRLLGRKKLAAFDDRTEEDYVTIDDYKILTTFDLSERSLGGVYGSRSIHMDTTMKPDVQKDRDYLGNFNDTLHVGNNPRPIVGKHKEHLNNELQRWDVILESSGLFTQEKPRKTRPQRWFNQGRSLREQMESFRLEIHTGFIKELVAGMTVNIRLPQISKEGMENAKADEAYSGRYLITNLRRTFQNSFDGFLTMEMGKDCLEAETPFSI